MLHWYVLCHVMDYYKIYIVLQVNSSYLRGPYTEYVGREGLMVTTLGLKFEAGMQHFRSPVTGHQHQRNRHDRDMKLKCVATLGTVYWKSKEQSALAHRPRVIGGLPIPPIDDSGTSIDDQDADSRADPVHGKLYVCECLPVNTDRRSYFMPMSTGVRIIHIRDEFLNMFIFNRVLFSNSS